MCGHFWIGRQPQFGQSVQPRPSHFIKVLIKSSLMTPRSEVLFTFFLEIRKLKSISKIKWNIFPIKQLKLVEVVRTVNFCKWVTNQKRTFFISNSSNMFYELSWTLTILRCEPFLLVKKMRSRQSLGNDPRLILVRSLIGLVWIFIFIGKYWFHGKRSTECLNKLKIYEI